MTLRIYVARLGDPEWPRFAVRFGKGRFFTGNGWSHDLADALLYHDKQEAENQAMYMDDNTPPRRFVTTALVLVDCTEPLTIEAIQELLEEATVSVIVEDQDNMNDVDVYITLDVEGLEEVG